jgi:hypothetical protein
MCGLEKTGFLSNSVENSAAATPAEDHCVGALESFDAFKVVEVPIILNVVANAVQEEVG